MSRAPPARASPGAPTGVDVDDVFESYGRYWLEIFRLPAEVRARRRSSPNFTIDGYEHITAGLAAGKGVILALPHLGGWEWAAAWMARAGPPHARGRRTARAAGAASSGSRASARRSASRSCRSGPTCRRACCVRCATTASCACLRDRDLTGDGVEVEFFGERTTLPGGSGDACAAHGRGAPAGRGVLRPGPRPSRRGAAADRRRRVQGGLRDDIARITQVLAHEFEALIRVAPEQWHLLQPNWPSDR